jgi:Ca2+-binding RTX toxin-like protein
MEALEDRSVPAILFSSSLGVITIQGDANRNVAEVRYDNRGTLSVLDDKYVITQRTGPILESRSYDAVKIVNGLPVVNVLKVVFHGYAGDDVFRNFTVVASAAYGEDGNDQLWGGSGADYLNGGMGSDSLYGGAGADYLEGGGWSTPSDSRRDYLDGGAGADTIVNYRDDFHRAEDLVVYDPLDRIVWRSAT